MSCWSQLSNFPDFSAMIRLKFAADFTFKSNKLLNLALMGKFSSIPSGRRYFLCLKKLEKSVERNNKFKQELTKHKFSNLPFTTLFYNLTALTAVSCIVSWDIVIVFLLSWCASCVPTGPEIMKFYFDPPTFFLVFSY